MKKLSILLCAMCVSIFLANCAATYKASTAEPVNIDESITGSKGILFAAAKRALFEEGFAVQFSNEDLGEIIAKSKSMKFDKSLAHCGTNVGLPANWTNNMVMTFTLTLNISDNNVKASSTIDGKDIRGNENYRADVACASLGAVENKIIQRIQNKVAAR
jgi:hypothetical protein